MIANPIMNCASITLPNVRENFLPKKSIRNRKGNLSGLKLIREKEILKQARKNLESIAQSVIHSH
jgi:hypothetical protein